MYYTYRSRRGFHTDHQHLSDDGGKQYDHNEILLHILYIGGNNVSIVRLLLVGQAFCKECFNIGFNILLLIDEILNTCKNSYRGRE